MSEDKKILANLIRTNNVNSLKTFIESNRNYLSLLNESYEDIPFLFYIRTTKFNPEFLDCLIDYGLNINIKDGYGQTLLMKSIEIDNIKIFNYLMRIDCDLNLTDDSGQTALHYACYNLDINKINTLLIFGADPNIPDIYGDTPIFYVVTGLTNQFITKDEKYILQEKAIASLLKYKANLSQKNNKGLSVKDILETSIDKNNKLTDFFKII
jgi:hypothetical protein